MKANQLDLFGVNDTPLFSGSPVRVKVDDYNPVKRDEPGRQLEMSDEPSLSELESWMMDGICEATDGCIVEPDGVCSHGCQSWLLVMGLI